MAFRHLWLGIPFVCVVNCANGSDGAGTSKEQPIAEDENEGGTPHSEDEPTKGGPKDTGGEPKGNGKTSVDGKSTSGSSTTDEDDATAWTPPMGMVDAAAVNVGDEIDGEEVIDVWGDDGCQGLLLRGKPKFECGDAQLAALEQWDDEELPSEASAETSLQVSSCDALADLRRPAMKASMHGTLASSYRYELSEFCQAPLHTAYVENGEWVGYCSNSNGWADAGVEYEDSPEGPGDEGEASEYSTTNTQVQGVDEADYVKNDGGTIYVLNDDALLVFDAWPVEEMKEVARVALPAEPRRMFLADDRLVVYLRTNAAGQVESDCTYGYDCRSASEGGSTLVQVYDVSEPESPLLLKEYQFSGAYLASRRVGASVYSVVHDGPAEYPDADYALNADNPDELEAQYKERIAHLDDLVAELPSEYFLPWVTQNEPGAEPETVTSCEQALVSSAARGTSFLSVVGFDLTTLDPPKRTLVAGKPGFVYGSAEALYVAVDGVDGTDDQFSMRSRYDEEGDADAEQSTIHKFAIADAQATYRGSQAIPGHVLNQFSMDEQDAVLRVASSSGWVPDPETSSNITTLAEQDGQFRVLGKLRGLAPAEDIRSVRFDGDRGFVVTFKKTDPLFVIGLGEPTKPVVLGELKIPGFSTYMHMLDEDHLLAVGFDADDHDDFAFFDGIQVQIFDVTYLTEPKLLHKTVLGTRGSGSEALMDHLAFNYFPSRNVLALPATLCSGGDDGDFGDKFEFAGLVIFDISLENGITERGRLPFVTPEMATASDEPVECAVWWSDSSSLVKRSIFLEDYAVGISNGWLKAAALDDLGEVLQSLPLE